MKPMNKKPMNKKDLKDFKKLMEIHRRIFSLQRKIEVLKEKLSIAKDALTYYADPENNKSKVFTQDGVVIMTSDIVKDGGKVAFKVLTEVLDPEN